jgi:hypothetical protein
VFATLDEIKGRPGAFDCARCERQQKFAALWPENRIAWDCYQALGHRTVRDIQAGAWVITHFTAGWSWQRIADLLARVDLLLEILVPVGAPEDHGRRPAQT